MDNLKFLQSIGVEDEEAQHRCLAAMLQYCDNHWWELDVDPRKFAYYQVNEGVLLTNDFGHFKESLSLLLDRPVYTHEFRSGAVERLRQEADRAWKYQVGVTSDKERQERVAKSIEDFHDWAKENGKQAIDVNLPDE